MLVVFTAFLTSRAPGQSEIILPWEEQVLLDRHVLTGVKNFVVQVLPADHDSKKDLPPWNELVAEVKQQFDEAQIDIIMRKTSYEQPHTSVSPVLEIEINGFFHHGQTHVFVAVTSGVAVCTGV